MREKQETAPELFDAQYRTLAFSVNPNNPLLTALQGIDKLLDEVPEILDLVHAQINRNTKHTGRPAEATAEQVLRSAILMQLRGLHYRQLAEEIDVNALYRKFTRFYGKKIPHFSTLNDLIKMISAETMQRINEAIVVLAREKKVEDGKAVRHDTTVTETDIALPVDARLLNDSVRVMSRLLARLLEAAPQVAFRFRNHTLRSKKRAYQIVMGKGKNIEKRRRKLYEDLLKVQAKVRGYAGAAVDAVRADDTAANDIEVMACVVELERVHPLCERVWDQAHRRVILGESVPAEEKIVSIFEVHTDIICRGKKGSKTEFGHKVAYATGRSGLVTYYEVFDGNPGDNEVLERALDDHVRLFGQVPKHLTGDRRYHSQANEQMAHEKGVERVALPKPGRLNKARTWLQRQPWFRRLLRWRAGIEGNLSTLLRTFGLKRCFWKGWESFKAYVGLSVLTYNLRLLAGHLCNA